MTGKRTMKRLALLLLLPIAPALAQDKQPPLVAVRQDVLQRASVFLQSGGSHNEGYAVAQDINDAVALSQALVDLKASDAAKTKAETDLAALQKQIPPAAAAAPNTPPATPPGGTSNSAGPASAGEATPTK